MSLSACDGLLVFQPKKSEYCQIYLDNVLFFEHRDRKVIIHTLNMEYQILNISLTKVEKVVGNYGFIRTHRAYIVQTKKIYKLVDCGDRTAQIIFHNKCQKTAYLSRSYRHKFPFFADNIGAV